MVRSGMSLKTLTIYLWLSVLTISPNTSLSQERPAPYVGTSFKGIPCRGTKGSAGSGGGYGPYDYTQRSSLAHNLKLVEDFHFTPSVENLISGKSGSIPADIDYTIDAWPNHHRALNAITRYALRSDSKKKPPLIPVECYFQRAINYNPDDSISALLYGIFLHRNGHHQQALHYYNRAKQLSPADMQIQYNLGLLLIDMKDYGGAKEIAHQIYQHGYPLVGLKNRLSRLGYWGTANQDDQQ